MAIQLHYKFSNSLVHINYVGATGTAALFEAWLSSCKIFSASRIFNVIKEFIKMMIPLTTGLITLDVRPSPLSGVSKVVDVNLVLYKP